MWGGEEEEMNVRKNSAQREGGRAGEQEGIPLRFIAEDPPRKRKKDIPASLPTN